MKDKWNRTKQFFEEKVWTVDDASYSRVKRGFFHQVRIFHIVVKKFRQDGCIMLSSSLSYFTTLAVIPIAVLGLVMFNSVRALSEVRASLENFLAGHLTSDAVQGVGKYIGKILENIQSNKSSLGVAGIIGFILVIMGLFNIIERSFDTIWKSKRERTWMKKLTVLWTLVTLGPFLLGLSVYLSLRIQRTEAIQFLLQLPLIGVLFWVLVPMAFTWLGFTLIYMFAPNAHVRFKPALMGAILAGSVWELAKIGFSIYMTQFVSVGRVYGSLGLVPMFLVWIYVSWMIVLFGGEFAYAMQNVHVYREKKRIGGEGVTEDFVALKIIMDVSRKFASGKGPVTVKEILNSTGLPPNVLAELLKTLSKSKFIARTADNKLLPEREPAKLLAWEVLTAVRASVERKYQILQDEETAYLSEVYWQMEIAARNSLQEKSILDMINELEERNPQIPASPGPEEPEENEEGEPEE